MKLITRDTDYAVRALCFIGQRKKKLVSASELVASLKIPRPFLRKILQTLNRQGILNSCKGKGGGFSLAVPAQKIYLINLIKIFQGSVKINECLFKKAPCPDIRTCRLRQKIDSLQARLMEELKRITLASLLKEREKWPKGR